jgi:hypothetical protein
MADRIKQMQQSLERKIKELESSPKAKKSQVDDMPPKKNGLLARSGMDDETSQPDEQATKDVEAILAEYIINIRKFRDEALNAKD